MPVIYLYKYINMLSVFLDFSYHYISWKILIFYFKKTHFVTHFNPTIINKHPQNTYKSIYQLKIP